MRVKKPNSDLMASEVRTKLRSMILASEFRPGQRLVEDELTALLGAGRTPVREALLLLQGEGFLSRERGWIVQNIDNSKIHAIFESRAAIEGATARLAARRITADQRKKLAAAIEAMEPGATLKRAELNRINNEFHGLIVRIADNPFLAQFHERTLFYYWMLRIPIMFAADQLAATNAQHRRILEALVRKDGDAAERAAREHVEATMNIVEPALQGI